MNKTSVLFVCLGNICRSPLAEGVFRHLVKEAGIEDHFEIDSCGTGDWHIGGLPDPGSLAVAKKHNIDMEGQRSRQIKAEDLQDFDYIYAMDEKNLRDIKKIGSAKGKLHLFREFDIFKSKDLNVPDPYGLTGDAFGEVYDIVYRCSENILEEISKDLDIEK